MAQVLPATVEELNMQHNLRDVITNSNIMLYKSAFEDIPTEKRLKREVSLPNGVQNWNISNFDSYLNFDEAHFEAYGSPDDRIVPEGDLRGRCSSISSVSSFADEKHTSLQNFSFKTINTVRMDSGSTCISSDHSYFNSTLHQGLDPEETYQNLDLFLQEVPELKSDSLPPPMSPLPSTSNDELFDFSIIDNPQSFSNDDSFASTSAPSTSSKRSLEYISEDDVLVSPKQMKQEVLSSPIRYSEIRRKNNIASKNSRMTRKEKQKKMDNEVSELQQENEHLKLQVQVLEEMINAHKKCLLNAIAQKR